MVYLANISPCITFTECLVPFHDTGVLTSYEYISCYFVALRRDIELPQLYRCNLNYITHLSSLWNGGNLSARTCNIPSYAELSPHIKLNLRQQIEPQIFFLLSKLWNLPRYSYASDRDFLHLLVLPYFPCKHLFSINFRWSRDLLGNELTSLIKSRGIIQALTIDVYMYTYR